MKKLLALALLIIVTISNGLFAQVPGDLDMSFNNDGILVDSVGSSCSSARAIAIQSDGKIIAAGRAIDTSNTHEVFALARYLANGDRDLSFGNGGEVALDLFSTASFIYSLAIQPDGKILAAGTTYTVPFATNDLALVRFKTNGEIDSSFGINGKVITSVGTENSILTSIALQPDGKIVGAGFRSTNSFTQNDFVLVRYLDNGTIDSTFNNTGKLIFFRSGLNHNSILNSVLVQLDGKIVAAGGEGISVVRCNEDGSFDNSFNTDGKFYAGSDSMSLSAVALQADGKIVVAGRSMYGYPNYVFMIARIDSNGYFDNSFGTNGITYTDFFSGDDFSSSIAVQADGRIVVAGSAATDPNQAPGYTDYDFALARYNTNGTLDLTFNGDGKLITELTPVLSDYANAMAIQADQKIVVAGDNSGCAFGLVRYEAGVMTNTTENWDATKTILVYPNPFDSEFTLQHSNENAVIILYDLMGREIMRQKIESEETLIHVPAIAPGLYKLCYTHGSQIITKSIISN